MTAPAANPLSPTRRADRRGVRLPEGRWSVGRGMSDEPRVHPKNVPGPIYVLYDCCTQCGVPQSIAPDLFSNSTDETCYVKQQPSSEDDWERALKVVRAQELGCIRYRGFDRRIVQRLADAGEVEQCDHPGGVVPVLRNVVTFAMVGRPMATAIDLVGEFSRHMCAGRSAIADAFPEYSVRTTTPLALNGGLSFSITWYRDKFHPVTIRPIDEGGPWRIQHGGNVGLSESLDDWLTSDSRFTDVRWYSEDAWRSSGPSQRHPW